MAMLREFLFELALACIPIITVYSGRFLYAKWEEVKDRIKATKIQNTLNDVVEIVVNVVQATNQTFVDELKKNGEFTKDAATEAFIVSKDKAFKMLSTEAANIIKDVYGDVSTYLDVLIEATVRDLKK